MVNYYDELEIEDFAWDPVAKLYHYPCPCGDRFEISKSQLRDGEEIAICPSCSLIVRVVYDYLDWEDYVSSDDEEELEDDLHEDEDSPATSSSSPSASSPVLAAESKPADPSPSTAETTTQPRRPPNTDDSEDLGEKMNGLQVKDRKNGEDGKDGKDNDI